MAFELPIDFDGDSIEKAFDRIIGKVDTLDQKIKGLNTDMGQTRTVSGRAVALPQSPADRASGLASAQTVDRGRPAFPGEVDYIGPLRAPKTPPSPRGPFPGEHDFVGPLSGARARAAFAGESDFIGPPRGPTARTPFAGENDFIGPMPGPPETKERVTRAGKSASTDPWSYEGPRQRAARDAAMLDRARATGDVSLIGDWEDRAKRSQAHVDRLDGKVGFGSLVNNALMRSRLNAGPLSPLLMDLAPMLGEGVMAGLGVAGIGAGVVRAGYEQRQRNNAAFYSMGGSNSLGALALGGDNAEAKALQLGDRLREGTVGSGYLRSQGVQYRGRYTDVSGNYTAAIDAIARIDDPQERVRVARETGLTDDVWLGDLSGDERRRLMRSRGMAGTPEQQARQRQDGARTRSRVERAKNYLGQGAEFAFDMAVGPVMDLLDGIDSMFGGNKPKSTPVKAGPQGWDRNAFRPMSDGPETINGTTMGAIPAGWRGKLMSDVLDNQGIMVGGFTI